MRGWEKDKCLKKNFEKKMDILFDPFKLFNNNNYF
jgi:hypothetical protein